MVWATVSDSAMVAKVDYCDLGSGCFGTTVNGSVFRELKPKCCFVLTRFQVFEVQGLSFGSLKPRSALAQATRTLKSSVWKSVSARCV